VQLEPATQCSMKRNYMGAPPKPRATWDFPHRTSMERPSISSID